MARECPEAFIIRKPSAAMVRAMLTNTAIRPSFIPKPLPGSRAVDAAAMIVLFESEEAAQAALPRLGGIRVLGQSASGVRMLAPAPGLRETLYATGALLVVG
jgi:hypothetical protein